MSIWKENKTILFFTPVFILVPVSYLMISTSQERAVVESLLSFLISLFLIIVIANNRSVFIITRFDLVCLFFILYLLLKNLFFHSFDISLTSNLLFLTILYFGLKVCFLRNRNSLSLILFFITIVTLLIYITFIYFFYSGTGEITNLYLKNKSIFSILLASQIALVISLYLHFKANNISLRFINCALFIIIISSTVLLALTNGRSGWLGFTLAITYIFYRTLSNQRFKKAILYFILPLGILLLTLLFAYKPDSSNGRLLVYKVSAGMLKDNWLFGIGGGQFKVQYNQSQAAYFATHDIDSKEAMLADNTFYAFNDFFQLIIENGIISFLFLIVAGILLIQQIRTAATKSQNRQLIIASTASIICIITGSLFSYPLQIFPIIFQAIICLSLLSAYSNDGLQIILSKKMKRISIIAFMLIGVFLVAQFYFHLQFSRKSLQAFELERSGFKRKATQKYKELNESSINDGNVMYLYAHELYHTNQPNLAAKVLSEAKKYYCSNSVYKLSAQIEQQLQHYSSAEGDYKTAVYMVPNRIISRWDLLNYYIERKDTANIIYWSNSIINMPVKVLSQITINIQEKAKKIFLQYRAGDNN